MDKKFDFDVTEQVIKKLQEDTTGELSAVVNDMIFNSKKMNSVSESLYFNIFLFILAYHAATAVPPKKDPKQNNF